VSSFEHPRIRGKANKRLAQHSISNNCEMRIRDSTKDLWHRRNESVKALPWHEVTNVNDPSAPFPSGAPPALRLVERLKTYRVDPVANHSKSVPGEAVGLLNALSQERAHRDYLCRAAVHPSTNPAAKAGHRSRLRDALQLRLVFRTIDFNDEWQLEYTRESERNFRR